MTMTREKILSDLNPNPESESSDVAVNARLTVPLRRELNTFRDIFNIELERFTAIDLSVRTKHKVELGSLLWKKFGCEIRRLGKDINMLEICSSELQHEVIEWFFAGVQGSIEEIHHEKGHKWMKAVVMYFDRLCVDGGASFSGSSVASDNAVASPDGISGTFEDDSASGTFEDDSSSEFFDHNELFSAGVKCLLRLYCLEDSP